MTTTLTDFKAQVAIEFTNRPTLRSIAQREVLKVLAARHEEIARAGLADASSVTLEVSGPAESEAPHSLVEVVLESLRSGRTLASRKRADSYWMVGVAPPHYLRGDDGEPMLDTKLDVYESIADLDDLVLLLPGYMAEAQAQYWAGVGSQGVSRDTWLQQVIKSALLRNLPLHVLDSEELKCAIGLLAGRPLRLPVYAVEVELSCNGKVLSLRLPELLVWGEREARRVILWCSPSSVVRAFESIDELAVALRDELAQHHRFDSMTWHRYQLEGDVFAQQTALMLDNLMQALDGAAAQAFPDVADMERRFAALSDPAGFFIEGYGVVSDTSLMMQPGLRRASPADSFAHQRGLFELALAQAESQGRSSQQGILDLHGFARRQLRETMLDDFPIEANYFPDDLILTLTVARGIPGGAGAGVGGGAVETRTMTLTEFAIGNLGSLQGANLTGITHKDEQLIMDWMNVDYLKSLVQRVDIGGSYPAYVAQQMDAEVGKNERIEAFAREWRCSLLFSALSARLGRRLSEAGLQCVVDYCGNHVQQTPVSMLMPLTFKRQPDEPQVDKVAGMYVLFCIEPSLVLLYRPLYGVAALSEFKDIPAMMVAIAQPGALQDSILDWLAPQARKVYAHGGFNEPHLPQVILDTSAFGSPVHPSSFTAQFWRSDIDTKLYQANRDLLVELADRQSVSNAESHWAILTEGAWLLFDVVSLVLRGPVAVVAWVAQAIASVDGDLSRFDEGSAFERSAAVVDLLLNLGMAMAHARLPRLPYVPAEQVQTAAALPGKGVQVAPTQGKVYLPGALPPTSSLLDFSWRGAQGFNVLPAERRTALLAMRSAVDLQGLVAEQGVYAVDARHYVQLAGDVYQVQLSAEGVRIVGASGDMGPWLEWVFDSWRVDGGLRLRGGMPKRRVTAIREQNQKEYEVFKAEESVLATQHNNLAEVFNRHQAFLTKKEQEVLALEALSERDELQQRELDVNRELSRRTRLSIVEDMKLLISNDIKHDDKLLDIHRAKFTEETMAGALRDQRSRVRQELLDQCERYYNEVAKLINEEDVASLAQEIVVHPESEAEIQQYEAFRVSLKRVVDWETDLARMATDFDQKLEDTLKDDSFRFRDEQGNPLSKEAQDTQIQDIIKQRKLTSIDLDFSLLKDLAEASLDRLADVEEKTLISFHDALAGESMQSAGATHGELAGSELSLLERIEVLTGVLEAYQEAAVMTDYLSSMGGGVVRLDMLKRYIGVLGGLQRAAESEMAQAIRELELAAPRLPRVPTYASRGGRRRLVRTHRGRSVLGVESEVDGVAVVQQQDADGQHVLKSFHEHHGEWLEDVPAPEVTGQDAPVSLKTLRKTGNKLVDEVYRVIGLASQYIASEEPNGLSMIIDGHMDKLRSVQAELPRTPGDHALHENIGQAIRQLQDARREQLIRLHTVTKHPTAASLRFLLQEKLVTIQRPAKRVAMSSTDYLDVYEVRHLPVSGHTLGVGLWEAHFHYPQQATPETAFSKGHLKLWSQRKLGREAQLRAAASAEDYKDLLKIYRCDLKLNQVEGIIPFE